ncbi:MobF family relaxase [Dendrosporobacter sp. 1207_IL3150]|uniref:MobF family relaxase n=1 Tax=Dendrosporobacter sp. 1207_IL3150 TaxID=3084054 RepID=UPI002FD9242B
MLSISNVGATQAGSYYQKDGYYARMGDDDRWQGMLKEELQLTDSLVKEDFNHFVCEHKERAGIDLCFSAPKSVSLAMVLHENYRQDMIDAHNFAVQKTLTKIEQKEIGTRVTRNGNTQHIKTGNMIVGCFNHYVSRNSDPQLHTHAVILNKTRYDEKYYAIDNPDLYKNKILYGQIYRNILAGELLQRGYEVDVTDSEKGFFDLKGVPQEVIAQFSTRREEIVQKMKEWGNHTPEAASKAAIMTRKAKEHKNIVMLSQSWRETLSEMGVSSIEKSDQSIQVNLEQKEQVFLEAIDRISNKNFAFSDKDMKKAALAAGVGTAISEEDYELLLQKASSKIVSLETIKGETYYTTPKNLRIEKEIFQEVISGKNTINAIPTTEADSYLNKLLKADQTSLSEQQRQAVIHIAASKDQYIAVQGLAGTGKTHMLNYAREVLECSGYIVKGACFTGKASQGLETDAQIPSKTIHAFLNQLEKEAGQQKTDIDKPIKAEWDFSGLRPGNTKEAWIVDEASMVDNNTMRAIMEAAKIKQAKVILVGDRQQLLPVGIGNAFSVLTEKKKINTVTLDEIRRQENPELLRAVKEAVHGDLSKSLKLLEKDIKVIKKRSARIKAIVSDYTRLSPEEQKNTVILTAANKDRKEINKAVRDELVKMGNLVLGREYSVTDAADNVEKRAFSTGDKVIFLQNDYKLGVRNGQAGVIKAMGINSVVVQSGEKPITVHFEQYSKLDYGYAMTAHKAQGITVDRAFINLDSSQNNLNNRNAYYVDISRARHEVKIYVDDSTKIEKQVQNFANKLSSVNFSRVSSKEKKLHANEFDHFKQIQRIPRVKRDLVNELRFSR